MADMSPASSATPGGATPRLRRTTSSQRGFSFSSEAPPLDELVIPQHEWLPTLMRKHPDVLELREQLQQVLGLASFGSLPTEAVSRTEIPETIDPDMILRLIDQFLREYGFDRASETLRLESGAFIESNPAIMLEATQDGDLQNMIRLGITPSVFDPPPANDPDPELEAMIDGTDTQDQDVNIWHEPSTIAAGASMQQANYLNPSGGAASAQKNLILEKLHGGHGVSRTSANDEELEPGHTHTVKGATFNQLVLWLLSGSCDTSFRHAFFATLSTFATPQQFITKVEQRYTTPPGLPRLDEAELFSIANTMTMWVNMHGHEFSNHTYMLLNKFVDHTFIRDGHQHIGESLQNVIAKQAAARTSRKTSPFLRHQQQLLQSQLEHGATNAHSPFVPQSYNAPSIIGASMPGSSSAPLTSILASSRNNEPTPIAGISPAYLEHKLMSTKSLFPEPKLPKNIFDVALTLDDIDEEEIARQLTCLDGETFARVKTQEMLNNTWMKNRGKKSKRIALLLNASNALARWVLDSVVLAISAPPSSHTGISTVSYLATAPSPSKSVTPNHYLSSHLNQTNIKRVAKVISRWLKICDHLRALNNFHSLLAIWSALRSRPVGPILDSLKKDKELTRNSTEYLASLDALFSYDDSYAVYRTTMMDVVTPCVPAVALHLRDLAFLEEVHPDFLRHTRTLINFRKRRMLYSIIKDVLRHQQQQYNLLQVYQVSDRIQTCLIHHFEALQGDKPGGHYDCMAW